MNEILKDTNELLLLCSNMKSVFKRDNINTFRDSKLEYKMFHDKARIYYEKYNLLKSKYNTLIEPYYYPKYTFDLRIINGHFCYEEIEMIENIILKIKNDLCKDYFDKIFISHKEQDKEYVRLLINLLHSIGIPRPATDDEEMPIFCSSYPPYSMLTMEDNKKRIKRELQSNKNIFTILLYSNIYFSSTPCLNEMGAVWVLDKKKQVILTPNFNSSNINGLLEDTETWFKMNDSLRLNDFKNNIIGMFGLNRISENSWEQVKTDYLRDLSNLKIS